MESEAFGDALELSPTAKPIASAIRSSATTNSVYNQRRFKPQSLRCLGEAFSASSGEDVI